jgi:hypothetical protein
MDELEEVVQQLTIGARQRELRILEAVFPVEPTVVLRYETTAIDEALDLAQYVFAPFLSIDVSRLAASDLSEDWDPDIESASVPPPELLRRWEEHDGQIDGVFVRWLASGSVYLYMAVPAWKLELNELREEWSEEQDAQRVDGMRAHYIRITHLAERLEREPTYRAATPQSRRSIGKAILGPLLRSGEGSVMELFVLKEASRLVRDNAAEAYALILDRIDELAAELRTTDSWTAAYRVADRVAAVRSFLIDRTGGYAPAGMVVDQLRRAAER